MTVLLPVRRERVRGIEAGRGEAHGVTGSRGGSEVQEAARGVTAQYTWRGSFRPSADNRGKAPSSDATQADQGNRVRRREQTEPC